MLDHIEYDEFLTKILTRAQELTGAQSATIFVVDGSNLVEQATTSKAENRRRVIHSITEGERAGLTGWVLKHEVPIAIDQPNFLPQIPGIKFRPKAEEDEEIRSVLVAPIKSGESVIGVINVTNKNSGPDDAEGFTPTDMEVIGILAETAAAAIEAKQQLLRLTEAPYVFVLMPFDSAFSDIYELGIKETAESIGMRCERVDEIEFNDNILSQIYKSIQSADVIVADMTGRNPNVFYEVGYAHALNKEVILLTQDVADIPFDLKTHNHIVYKGRLTQLRGALKRRLKSWLKRQPSNPRLKRTAGAAA